MKVHEHLLKGTSAIGGTINSALMQANPPVKIFYQLAGTVSGMLGFYHGYKRNNDSIGWGLWWFLMSGFFWPITMPLAVAQGFGKSRNEVHGLAGFKELRRKFRNMRRR